APATGAARPAAPAPVEPSSPLIARRPRATHGARHVYERLVGGAIVSRSIRSRSSAALRTVWRRVVTLATLTPRRGRSGPPADPLGPPTRGGDPPAPHPGAVLPRPGRAPHTAER